MNERITIEVDGRRFDLAVHGQPDDISVRLKATDLANELLAEVINTGWVLGAKKLLEGANERRGFRLEQIAVTFRPDNGGVRLDYLDGALELPESTYVELLGLVGRAATAGDLVSMLPDGTQIKALSESLLARRA